MWDKIGYDIYISSWNGRLGNNILQLCCALFVAEKTKSVLSYPKHPNISMRSFDFRGPFQTNCGVSVKDQFFGHTMLKNLLKEYTEFVQVRISRVYIYPLLDVDKQHNAKLNVSDPKTLVIHMRSGDSMRKGVNKNYPQPPLAVYKKIISGENFSNVLIVTEKDQVNPCIGALKEFCDCEGLKCHIQTGSLKQDVSTIITARYLVTSQSSFAWSLLRCNRMCVCVFIPNIRFSKTSILPIVTEQLPFKQYFYGLPDYTCAGEWTFSAKQLKLMIEYGPIEKIPVKVVDAVF